jgi:hypothetical protein
LLDQKRLEGAARGHHVALRQLGGGERLAALDRAVAAHDHVVATRPAEDRVDEHELFGNRWDLHVDLQAVRPIPLSFGEHEGEPVVAGSECGGLEEGEAPRS